MYPLYCILYYLLLHCHVSGSVIDFQATPRRITQGLTSLVTLRCSLNNTKPSAPIVGRRDVTETDDNVSEVMSLVVMLNGKDIASVSHAQGPHVMDGSINIRVTGNTSASTSDESSYIQLEVSDPLPTQTGEFRCEINAISLSGHVIVFATTLEVSVTHPATSDLIAAIRDVSDKNDALGREISSLKSEVAQMKAKEVEMSQKYEDLKALTKVTSLFSVGLTKSVNVAEGHVVVFDKVFADVGGSYNTVTGAFVCKIDGFYQFEISALTQYDKVMELTLQKNFEEVVKVYGPSGNALQGHSNSAILKLVKGDAVRVIATETSGLYGNPAFLYTTFSGLLVSLPQ